MNDTREDVNAYVGLGLLDPADLLIRSIRMKLSCSLVGIVMFSRKKVCSCSGFSWSLDPAGSREHGGVLQLNPSWNTRKTIKGTN